MGQFSWLDCKTGEQVLDNIPRKVYVLVPKEFGGGHIEENCYDGYGNFGGKDIYDLVADWNREYISKTPEHKLFSLNANVSEAEWYDNYSDLSKSREEVVEDKKFEYRYIGIELACYDEDNEVLPYPVKITHDADAVYEDCEPSKSDPKQGWKY